MVLLVALLAPTLAAGDEDGAVEAGVAPDAPEDGDSGPTEPGDGGEADLPAVPPPVPFLHVRTLVIDPGHGGTDGGGLGIANVPEKVLALETSLALRDALLREDPTLRVILTREDDTYPELDARAHQAEIAHADALLSIHYNWAANPDAVGIETFHIAPEGTTPGEDVPGRDDLGPSLPCMGEGVAGDLEASIVADLERTGAIQLSRALARDVQRALIDATGAPDRGVRQAQFRVLRGITVPAVVVELGFLTHAEEGKRVFEAEAVEARVEGLIAGLRAWDAWLAETGLAEAESGSQN